LFKEDLFKNVLIITIGHPTNVAPTKVAPPPEAFWISILLPFAVFLPPFYKGCASAGGFLDFMSLAVFSLTPHSSLLNPVPSCLSRPHLRAFSAVFAHLDL
jgi:hypothetical protein